LWSGILFDASSQARTGDFFAKQKKQFQIFKSFSCVAVTIHNMPHLLYHIIPDYLDQSRQDLGRKVLFVSVGIGIDMTTDIVVQFGMKVFHSENEIAFG
jgi:hypothetical protein